MTRPWTRARWIVSLAAAAIVLPSIGWTAIATLHASFEPLGRDQGIFQYVGWALSHGARDYVDVHDINGPLVPLIHIVYQKLGGADEHVFRCLDLSVFGAGAVFFGALLPGVGLRTKGENEPTPVATRIAWGLASWVVLSAGYFLFDWWSHAQRESFSDELLVPSIGLQLLAHAPRIPPKQRRILLAVAGGLSALTWFGKPTCVIYSALQAAAIVLDDEIPGTRVDNFRAFASGCLAACPPMLAVLVYYGDIGAYLHTMALDFWMHRYIWHKSLVESYWAWDNAPKVNYVLVTLVAGSVGIATRVLPRRLLAVMALIVGGLLSFAIQGKGFPYHLQSAILGVHLLWIAAAAALTERAALANGRRAIAAIAVGIVCLAYQTVTETRLSPPFTAWWYDDRRGGGPESETFLRDFTGGDYFALDLHRAAAYLRDHTGAGDRVQTYGMDPYLLFLAQRQSATPYIYNFELNVDAALNAHPPERDRLRILETAAANAHDLAERLARNPPAAVVTMDRVPYTFPENADVDFAVHCPEAAHWVAEHYSRAAQFGTVRVWLRDASQLSPH